MKKRASKPFRHLLTNTLLHGLILLTFTQFIASCASYTDEVAAEGQVIMAVFAHPDDETLVGPILHQYANRGSEVILVTATDGRLGFTEWSGIEEEDELVDVRREELRCAADLLGVELIHLNYEDQLGIREGHNNLLSQSRGILRDLHQIIEERQPDVIITFGPDGFSNHMDHRIVGLSVTQVVLSKQHENTPALYYVGIPSSFLLDDDDQWKYMGVDDRYLTVQVPFSEEEADVARLAALCHESQFLPEFVAGWFDTMREQGNVIYFRPFEAPRGQSNDLLRYPD